MRKKIVLETRVTNESTSIAYKLGNWTMLTCYKLHTSPLWTVTTTINLPKFIQAELGASELYPRVRCQAPPTLAQALDIQKELKLIADRQMAYLRINRLEKQLDKQKELHLQDMHGDHSPAGGDSGYFEENIAPLQSSIAAPAPLRGA